MTAYEYYSERIEAITYEVYGKRKVVWEEMSYIYVPISLKTIWKL